jgi:ketosteroid isomerase-like protein
MTHAPPRPLDADALRELFAGAPFDESVNEALAPYYAEDVVFTDPIQTVRGRTAFLAMNRRLVRRARSIRFDARSIAQRGDDIFITWTMTMTPRPIGPTLVIDGVTHVTLRDGLVWRHTDYWDLLGSMMDAVPFAGSVYRAVVRLAG